MSNQQGTPIRPTSTILEDDSSGPPLQNAPICEGGVPTAAFNTNFTDLNDPLAAGPSTSRRRRKDRCHNWQTAETLVLIHIKRTQHFNELNTPDQRDLMTPEVTKWAKVAEEVMRGGFSPCICDGQACKTKWNQVVPEYKKISDYHGRSGQNIQDFWDLSIDRRKQEGLPKHFSQEYYVAMHEWFCTCVQINPAHHRDVCSPHDTNFLLSVPLRQRSVHRPSNSDSKDPIQIAERQERLYVAGDDLSNPRSQSNANFVGATQLPSQPGVGESITAAFRGVPMGVTPVNLSSSRNTSTTAHARLGNTGVKRKNMSGPTEMAEATRNTGAVLASQMRDISDASLQVERSKVEVQLKLFGEQMAYQRERDMRLHETTLLAHDNARLCVLKQHEMVQCLQQLTTVLGAGLPPRTHAPDQYERATVHTPTIFMSPQNESNGGATQHGDLH